MGDFHSSPSDMNLFIEEPACWFVKNFIGYRTVAGPAAHRGNAVEYGVAIHLLHPSKNGNFPLVEEGKEVQDVPIGSLYRTATGTFLKQSGQDRQMSDIDLEWFPDDSLKDHALRRYRQLTFGEINDEIEEEAVNVEKMLEQSLTALRGIGGILQWQRRIDSMIEGIPVMGYLDFVFPTFFVDLKSTKSVPSAPRPGHVRQIAIYSAATGLPARLLYASGKRFLWHDISESQSRRAMRQVRAACRAMRRIRDNPNWRDAAISYPPRDLESFYWDSVARYIAEELWEINDAAAA